MQNDDIFIPKLTKRTTFKERHYNQPLFPVFLYVCLRRQC